MESKAVVTCINVGGFEDTLTLGQEYEIKVAGANSYCIENDKGNISWYGTPQLKVTFK
ncbi:hypothetical protein N9924_01365 [bacterium]|nr:hypothetical protein [bacterium]